MIHIYLDTREKRWNSRIFGEQVIAQAYVAANETVSDDMQIHSLHAYFLRPGVIKQPVLFSVDPVRDGKVFLQELLRLYRTMKSFLR